MNEHPQFLELCAVIDKLLGPDGCPWDKKQTLQTLKASVLEETCELIDAIEENEAEQMADELGDLFFNVIFLAKVAAKEGHFTLNDSLSKIIHKLITRHPHVFGNGPTLFTDHEVIIQWEEIKKKEKGHAKRTSLMDGIPKALPSLSRAEKMIVKMKKANYRQPEHDHQKEMTEEMLGEKLFKLVAEGNRHGLNAELALRKSCISKEKAFRQWEQNTPQ